MKSKIMKKLIVKIGVIICIIFIIHKVYHFLILNKIHSALESFKAEENSYCSVKILKNNYELLNAEIFKKSDEVKYVKNKDNIGIYYEFKNFNTGKQIIIDVKEKTFVNEDVIYKDNGFLVNLPRLMLYTYLNGKMNLGRIFDIYYIISTKYNENVCYKIITKTEEILVDKQTLLPVYNSLKMIKSENNEKYEYENIYEFSIDNVTDEDMQLPDLKDYTNLNNIQ